MNAVANSVAIAQFSFCSYDSIRDQRSPKSSRTDGKGQVRFLISSTSQQWSPSGETDGSFFGLFSIRDYHLTTMRLPLPMRRISVALLMSLALSSSLGGCRKEGQGAAPAARVDANGPGVDLPSADPLVIEWQPLVAAAGRAVEVVTRIGRLVRDVLVREVAGLCRLDGWNQRRTIGYRERGWNLKRRTGPGRTRRLVLTFDDGPMKKKTPRILDLLAKHKVKATFFVVGRVIHSGSYRIVRRALKEGHTLANHSYHHLVDMHKHDRAAALIEAELELCQAMVDLALLAKSWRDFRALRIRMLGGKHFGIAKALPGAWPAIRARWKTILRERRPDGQSPHRMIFVRPPGGAPFSTRWSRHHRQRYALTLRRLGLINVMWDEDSGDSDRMLTVAERRDSDRLTDAILEGTKRGGVFLMHDRIGLGGFGQALRQLLKRKRLVVTDLPTAARAWYGCEAQTLSLVLQVLDVLGYRAPEPPTVKKPTAARPVVRKRRRRRRRVRKRRRRRRRVQRRTARRARPKRRTVQPRVRPRRRVRRPAERRPDQGLMPRRR